jgi:hypothetical protein
MMNKAITVAAMLLSTPALSQEKPMNQLLYQGAYQQGLMNSTEGGWRSMDGAPRDGTVIEIKCTYGVAPWFALAKWTDKIQTTIQSGDGKPPEPYEMTLGSPTWVIQGREGGSVGGESTLFWRPYGGNQTAYVDPTNGAQNLCRVLARRGCC